jgi:hypothetical protein
MNRAALIVFAVALAAAGCVTPAERQAALRPLPEDGVPLPYASLLNRAREQANLLTEAFHINNWEEMDEAAKGMVQTCRYLSSATDVPPAQKDALPGVADILSKEAGSLREAIKIQDMNERVDKSNEILRRISLKVRELRLDK